MPAMLRRFRATARSLNLPRPSQVLSTSRQTGALTAILLGLVVAGTRLAGPAAAVAASTPQTAPQGSLTIERVFGPEIKTGPYKHPARIEELANGDLYLVYYGGDGEYANRTAVYASRRPRGSQRWTTPSPIAQDPFRSLGNAVVWQSPTGRVWLFYVVRHGATWSTSRIQAKISDDQAHTWSDAFPLVDQDGMMVCNRPLLLQNGNWLLPIYHETGHDTEFTGFDSTSLFLRHDPQKGQWQKTGPIRSRTGSIQAAAVEIAPGHLIAYSRRCGNYDPTTNGWIVRAESHDHGATWTEGTNSAFPNPNAAIDFIRLQSGHLLLTYNDSMNDRTPLTLALSEDLDRSYPHRRNIAEGPFDYAYPLTVQGRDGRIHVIFTSHERTTINHAVVDENWIRHGGPVKSWLPALKNQAR